MIKYIKLFFLLLPVILIFNCKDNHEHKATIANLRAAIKGEIRDYKKYPIGSSFENLMNSINSEKLDVNEIYDRYAKIAQQDKI